MPLLTNLGTSLDGLGSITTHQEVGVRAGRLGPKRSERPRRFLDPLDPKGWGRLAQLGECVRRGLRELISRTLDDDRTFIATLVFVGLFPVALMLIAFYFL